MSIESWMEQIADHAAMGWLASLLRVLFGMLFAFFVYRLNRLTRRARKGKASTHNTLAALFSVTLLAVFVYQGTWQLAGFRSPELMAFMSRYSHRAANPKASFSRGRILDVNGLALADAGAPDGRGRVYPFSPSACHITGYIDPRYGRAGVERADDAHLSGRIVRDLKNLPRFGHNLLTRRMIKGNDTLLTLDARLQDEARRLLAGKRGAAVAIDPQTGAIRLLASAPTFDPLDVQPYLTRSDSPMLNRALHGQYAAGSTFKILVAAAAIEHKKTGGIECPAEGYRAGPGLRPIRDHEYYSYEREHRTWRGHGTIDMSTAFRKSSNVYFARLAVLLGAPALENVVRRFQMRDGPTVFRGADGTIGAKAGRIPKLTSDAILSQTAIGQGSMLVTPLQMARVAACVAADGKLFEPYLPADHTPIQVGTAMDVQTARTLQALMIKAVNQGTGRGALASGVTVGGKTGTAQNPNGEDHGWFVCFAPAHRPALALAVLVENGGYGSDSAVPIAAELLRAADQFGLLTRSLPPQGNTP